MISRMYSYVLCAVFIAIALPLVFRFIEPNKYYGFRTSVTLASEEIWYKANAFFGIVLIVCTLMSLALLWFTADSTWAKSNTWLPLMALLIPLVVAVLSTVIYLN